MTHKAKGARSRTRTLLARRNREKTSVNKRLQQFNIGSRVVIKPDSSENKGRPFKRFYGKSGIVAGKRGRSYIIKVKDKNKEKEIIASPVHLKVM
ncbi:MAG: 50S ribosomal protein L21e [Candidatus Aenigmarchaeota archaeon]|nr:50S ribosomal protein L21e [Candidatus Aenigmarchaeota archaeon]